MATKRVFTGKQVVLPDYDCPVPATLIVDGTTGRIIDVKQGHAQRVEFRDLDDAAWFDAGELIILPGLVDAHVHLNEPGRTEWEGFWTGTRAAASGGVTTVVDMPLNSIPPTTTVENLEAKRFSARDKCWIDVGFWGGVIPGNQAHLKPLVQAGVKGFKCFLIESGVEEFPCVGEEDLKAAMGELDELDGADTVLCFHAELDTRHAQTTPPPGNLFADPTLYSTFLHSRPPALETSAIELITRLHSHHPNLRLHIVHLSASDALPLIRAARNESKLPLTVETCFHYLCLSSEDVPDGRPEFKCCPPIRDDDNREKLWEALTKSPQSVEALGEGEVDFIVSDHSPCVAELKKLDEGDIMSAWGGISTLGLGLSLLWTEAQKRNATITSGGNGRVVTVKDLVRWCCEATAKHVGLGGVKGSLKVGADADIAVWDPEAAFTVTRENLNFKNKLSPYEGLNLRGRVLKTFLRGQLVYDYKSGFGEKPVGKLL